MIKESVKWIARSFYYWPRLRYWRLRGAGWFVNIV